MASLKELPAGEYRLNTWYPGLTQPIVETVTIAGRCERTPAGAHRCLRLAAAADASHDPHSSPAHPHHRAVRRTADARADRRILVSSTRRTPATRSGQGRGRAGRRSARIRAPARAECREAQPDRARAGRRLSVSRGRRDARRRHARFGAHQSRRPDQRGCHAVRRPRRQRRRGHPAAGCGITRLRVSRAAQDQRHGQCRPADPRRTRVPDGGRAGARAAADRLGRRRLSPWTTTSPGICVA